MQYQYGPVLTQRLCQVIFIDSPAYFLTFYTIRDCGLEVVEIPTDENGIYVDLVEEKLKSGIRPKLLYTVPICNNPTGVTLSIERRRRLVELSREYGFKISSLCVNLCFLQYLTVFCSCTVFSGRRSVSNASMG